MANAYIADSQRYRTRPSATKIPAQSADQFAISTTYVDRGKQYFGKLKVVRLTEKRVIYPYDGAEQIGPFESRQEAIAAAQILGEKLVESDLRTPE
jgi:hypothetical protein